MDRRLVVRSRLLEMVHARWTQRVVVIVGGTGFGKSVLLGQALHENRLAPHGFDLVVGRDEFDESLLETLDDLARTWTQGVCVVVDDVHARVATDAGQDLFTRLVREAPSSVHFLLAGRTQVRGLGALRAAGEVVELDEADLAFDEDENAALAGVLGITPAPLAATGGWAAFTAINATYGRDAATEYAWDEVVAAMSDRERRALAIAAAIGHCDPAALAVAIDDAGIDAVSTLREIPLVRINDGCEVHSLWNDVLRGAVDHAELRRALSRVVRHLGARGETVRAFDLAAAHELWDDAAAVVTASCSRGYIDVPAPIVARWLDRLPRSRWDAPDGMLLRGVHGRVHDPFAPGTVSTLQRAADGYRDAGNVAGEVAATTELAYVLRNQGRCDGLPALLVRAAELHAQGHAEVAGWMAMAKSAVAELGGDDAGMVAELDDVPADAFGPPWRAVVAFRRAIGHLALGHELAAIEAATTAADLADGNTVRHVLPLVQWFAGDPRPALAAGVEIERDAARSRVDGVALGTFAAMVLATAGRVDEAAARVATIESASSGPLSPRMRGYLIGVRALLAAARGNDDDARDELAAALAELPITTPLGRQAASCWLALAYVLVPDARDALDRCDDLGALQQRRIAVARAVVAAREAPRLAADALRDLPAELVATTVPLPWAAVLAARLADTTSGRDLIRTLFDLYGEPARDALRGVTTERRIARNANKLLAAIPLTPVHPVRLSVLGPTTLTVGGEPTTNADWQRERVRSLLTFLALKGEAHRGEIIDALWPDLDLDAGDRNLRVTLTYLHRVIEPTRQGGEAPFFVRQQAAGLTLAGTTGFVVDVDEFERVIAAADEAGRRGAPSEACAHLDRGIALWRGPCLADVAHEEWAQPLHRHLTGVFVRASVRAAELHLAAGNTWRARRLARRALDEDAWSEPAHRVLIRAALADGDHGGTRRALDACEAMLDDLGVELAPETAMLGERIRSSTWSRPIAATA
jgi:DNA-binding SARP family transcriptional activator